MLPTRSGNLVSCLECLTVSVTGQPAAGAPGQMSHRILMLLLLQKVIPAFCGDY